MIGNVIKYFRFSFDYVLWELSYSNLNMLLATIPDHEPPKADEVEEKVPEEKQMAELAYKKMAEMINK